MHILQAAEDKNTLTNLEMTEMLYSESQVDKMQCHHKNLMSNNITFSFFNWDTIVKGRF